MTAIPPKAKKPVPVASFIMRRVYMQGNFYHCGICKKPHQTGDEALGCLKTCWQLLLTKAPWTEVKRYGKLEFHCNYCQRAYATSDQARACAEDCSKKLSISTLDQTGLVVKRTRRVFTKPEKPLPVFPFKIPGKEHLMSPTKPGRKREVDQSDPLRAEGSAEAAPQSYDAERSVEQHSPATPHEGSKGEN